MSQDCLYGNILRYFCFVLQKVMNNNSKSAHLYWGKFTLAENEAAVREVAMEGRDEVDTSTFISPTLSLLFSKQLWLCCVFVCGWPDARCICCVCIYVVFMNIILLGRQWHTCRTATLLCSGEKRAVLTHHLTSFAERRSSWHTKLNFQFSISIYSRRVWRAVMYAHIHPHYCPFFCPW